MNQKVSRAARFLLPFFAGAIGCFAQQTSLGHGFEAFATEVQSWVVPLGIIAVIICGLLMATGARVMERFGGVIIGLSLALGAAAMVTYFGSVNH